MKKLSPFALTWLLCLLTNATVAWHQYDETRHYGRMMEQSEQLLEQGRRLELVALYMYGWQQLQKDSTYRAEARTQP